MSDCGICGKTATTEDGIVGLLLCDDAGCLDVAWERAFGDHHAGDALRSTGPTEQAAAVLEQVRRREPVTIFGVRYVAADTEEPRRFGNQRGGASRPEDDRG